MIKTHVPSFIEDYLVFCMQAQRTQTMDSNSLSDFLGWLQLEQLTEGAPEFLEVPAAKPLQDTQSNS